MAWADKYKQGNKMKSVFITNHLFDLIIPCFGRGFIWHYKLFNVPLNMFFYSTEMNVELM